MKLRLSSTSIAWRKCGRIASPARTAVRCANSRYSASSARGIENLALALGREHRFPCIGVVALGEPARRVAHRVGQRTGAQARALSLRAIDLHEARLVVERARDPQRQPGPGLDLLLDENRFLDPASLRRVLAAD